MGSGVVFVDLHFAQMDFNVVLFSTPTPTIELVLNRTAKPAGETTVSAAYWRDYYGIVRYCVGFRSGLS